MSIGFTDRKAVVDTLTPAEKARPITLRVDVIDDSRVKSILVADAADRSISAWLPRSELTIERQALGKASITMPTWLALDRGLTAMVTRGQTTLF